MVAELKLLALGGAYNKFLILVVCELQNKEKNMFAAVVGYFSVVCF